METCDAMQYCNHLYFRQLTAVPDCVKTRFDAIRDAMGLNLRLAELLAKGGHRDDEKG